MFSCVFRVFLNVGDEILLRNVIFFFWEIGLYICDRLCSFGGNIY